MSQLRIGAFGCVKTYGKVGLTIRFFLKSKVNHAFIYIGKGKIVEAMPQGAIISDLSKYSHKDITWSNVELTQEQRRTIRFRALSLVGTGYGFLDIFFLWAKLLGVHFSFLENRIKGDDRMICSQLVADCYARAGIKLSNKPAYMVTPKDLYDIALRD
jgi:uncharacterized protein YycO